MNSLQFRKAHPGEEPLIYRLILQRIDWMNQKGIDGWNRMDYASVYPLEHYKKILPRLFVLQDVQAKEILCAGALYDADDRWDMPGSAFYLHHFASKVGAFQVGTEFLWRAEEYARSQGKEYLRLDSAKDNLQLAVYYERHSYMPVGSCSDGPYQGILRQKRLYDYILRKANGEDLDQIVTIEKACFPSAEAASREHFQERIDYYSDHFWLLCDGERVISFVNGFATNEKDLTDEMYENAALHNPKGAWQMIFGVDTLPQYRRQGCAERLLHQVICDAKAQGRKGLVLTCKDHMIHYYTKFGFCCEGISDKSVHGNAAWNQMRLTF